MYRCALKTNTQVERSGTKSILLEHLVPLAIKHDDARHGHPVLQQTSAQACQQKAGEAYHLSHDESMFNNNPWDRRLNWMNWLSGLCFITGVILTTGFVAGNLNKAQQMTDSKRVRTQDGVPSPTMQKVSGPTDMNKGLPSPTLATRVTPGAAVPAPAPAPAPSAPPQGGQAPKK